MTSGSPEAGEAGYATATAAIICFAIAIAVSTVLTASLTQLRSSQADLERTQMTGLLDGAQFVAALRVMRNTAPGRLRWSETALDEQFDILAEREMDKKAWTSLTEPELSALGANSPSMVSNWIKSRSSQAGVGYLPDADGSAKWNSCAPSLTSSYGRSTVSQLLEPNSPARLGEVSHVAEVWRIVVYAKGWRDDRLVRITGNANQPALPIQRRLKRASGLPKCVLAGAGS